jgi:hypothetical protein
MRNQLVFIRRMLYQMKMQYGMPCDVYKTEQQALDLETGAKTVLKTKFKIDRAIIMSFRSDTVGFYSAALLKAAREFSYGGFQDQNIRLVTIDGSDLPDGTEITQADMIAYEYKRYEIKVLQKLEGNHGYTFVALHTPGSEPRLVHEMGVHQTLRVTQLAKGVI